MAAGLHFVEWNSDLGSLRPLDRLFDLWRAGRIAWAPLKTRQPEHWTASIK